MYKAAKDDASHQIQHIRIYYIFLGDVEIPDEWLDDKQDTSIQAENEQEETAQPTTRLCRILKIIIAHRPDVRCFSFTSIGK